MSEPSIRESADQSIEDHLRAAERSAVHLEMRDGYMRSDPDFLAWRNGQRWDPDLDAIHVDGRCGREKTVGPVESLRRDGATLRQPGRKVTGRRLQ